MCYSLWYKATQMLPAGSLETGDPVPPLPGYRPATFWVHYTTSCNTQSSVPVDGRNYRPKRVELIGIINKPLLLYLVGCLYYLYQLCTVKQTSNVYTCISWLYYTSSNTPLMHGYGTYSIHGNNVFYYG